MEDAPLVVRIAFGQQVWASGSIPNNSFGFMHILPNSIMWIKGIRSASVLQYCFFAHSGDEVIKNRYDSLTIPDYDIDAASEPVDEFFRDLYNSGLTSKEEIVLWAKMRQM